MLFRNGLIFQLSIVDTNYHIVVVLLAPFHPYLGAIEIKYLTLIDYTFFIIDAPGLLFLLLVDELFCKLIGHITHVSRFKHV